MPLFFYRCAACGGERRRILAPEQADSPGGCSSCGGVLERTPTGASALVIERIDTGGVIRAIERLADEPRLHRERQLAASGKQ